MHEAIRIRYVSYFPLGCVYQSSLPIFLYPFFLPCFLLCLSLICASQSLNPLSCVCLFVCPSVCFSEPLLLQWTGAMEHSPGPGVEDSGTGDVKNPSPGLSNLPKSLGLEGKIISHPAGLTEGRHHYIAEAYDKNTACEVSVLQSFIQFREFHFPVHWCLICL